MRTARLALVFASLVALPIPAIGQSAADTPTATQLSLTCAPPAALIRGGGPLHVIGAQDTVGRTIFHERDLVIVNGGSGKGVQVGQQYFTRRPAMVTAYRAGEGRTIETSGWLRVVAVNDTTAIAQVDHVCTYLGAGDYLDPFAAVSSPEAGAGPARQADLDFTAMGRVLYGPAENDVASVGGYMMIDRGAEEGVTPGTRFAIYRDVRTWTGDDRGRETGHLPLTAIGDTVVVTTTPHRSLVRVESARDAVQRGDYIVPRKK